MAGDPEARAADTQIAELQRVVRELRRRLEFVEGSKFWRLRAALLRLRRHFDPRVPIEPPEVRPVGFLETSAPADGYTRWLLENEPRSAELARMREMAPLLREGVSVAVIVDDLEGAADAAIAAAEAQVYPHLRIVRLSQIEGEDAAQRRNAAANAATEDLVVFCDRDDVLAPQAAFEAALAFNAHPRTVAVYGDVDCIEPDGRRTAPQFSPAWSPETFLSSMYTGRVIFYRREAVLAAGGFRAGYGDAGHYDLALRVFEASDAIVHRPSMLAHRAGTGASSQSDAVRAIEDALLRRGEPAHVVRAPIEGVTIVRYDVVRPGRTELVIPTRDLGTYLERCLRSVFERNARSEFRAIVVDNGSVEPATFELFERWSACEPERFRVVRDGGPFNFSRLVNAGVRSSDGPYVLLLNNDAEFMTDDGIEAMIEQAQRPRIGAVGARLLYADGTLQHAGVVVGIGGYAGHLYRRQSIANAERDRTIAGVRNFSAVTAAAMMFRREVFDEVGGFNEALAVEFNDLDFCLRLGRAGYRTVSLPHVVLRHEESMSRGTPATSSARASRERERALFRSLWDVDRYADPYYNPNLSRTDESGALA